MRIKRFDKYPNDQLYSIYYISYNIIDGIWLEFYSNGNKSAEGRYVNDIEEGYWIEWHRNGNKWCEGKYKNGKKIGIWKFWDRDEILWSEGVIN